MRVSTYVPAAKPCVFVRSVCCCDNFKLDQERRRAGRSSGGCLRLRVGDRQLQLVFVGLDDLGVLVGDEAAQLLHGHFDRHRRDERGFDQRAAAQATGTATSFASLFLPSFRPPIERPGCVLGLWLEAVRGRPDAASFPAYRPFAVR